MALGRQLGVQVARVAGSAGQVPAVSELIEGQGHAPHGSARELAERQPDHPAEHAIGLERRRRHPGALLVGGDEITGRVVHVGGLASAGDDTGPPAGRR